MGEYTVPVEVLGAALALCAALVGILANLLRREKIKNHSPSNPGLLGCQAETLGGVLSEIKEIVVRLDERIPRG